MLAEFDSAAAAAAAEKQSERDPLYAECKPSVTASCSVGD
jgi:hypothetical protein